MVERRNDGKKDIFYSFCWRKCAESSAVNIKDLMNICVIGIF